MKRIDIMNRSGFVKHGTKMILKFDLSGLSKADDVNEIVDYFASIALKMPKRSVLGLVDFTGMQVSMNTLNEMIRLSSQCNPHFKATAILALDVSTKNLATSVIHYHNSNKMKVFGDQGKAFDWLIGH